MHNTLTAFIIIAFGLVVTAALATGFMTITKNAENAYETVNEESSRLQGKDKKNSRYIIDPDTHEVTGRSADWDD